MTETTPREIKYGNDFFQEITIPGSSNTFNATYWDLWIAIILVDEFDNDIDNMISDLRTKNTGYSLLKSEFEGLLSHIRSLHQALAEDELSFSDILLNVDTDFIKKQKVKAINKIINMKYRPQEKSGWMIYTPKKLREDQAMRGHWHIFPVNPQKYADLLIGLYKSGFYTRGQSNALESKLQKHLEKHEKKASDSELFALYRAFLTVVLERMESVDDSYGVIGSLYEEVFKKYFSLDRSKLEMNPADFFLDCLELVIWEDYDCTDFYQADFFKSLNATEIPLVESILLQQTDELNSLELDYQAKGATSLLKTLHAQATHKK